MIAGCGVCLGIEACSETPALRADASVKNSKSEFEMIFPIPVIQIGRVALQLPGLTLLFGFWAATWLAAREAKRIGLKEDDVYTPAFLAAVAGIVGARLWYVAAHWESFASDPLGIVTNTDHDLPKGRFGKKPQKPKAYPNDHDCKVIEIHGIFHIKGNDSRNVERRHRKPTDPIFAVGDISKFQSQSINEHAKGEVQHSEGCAADPGHNGA